MEFGDYHDSYLTTNVLKLADIFEVSLDTCMNYYGLHHATLIRKPWISFTGNTKVLDVPLDLLIDSVCIFSLNGEYMVEWQPYHTLCNS